jgi:hypothetical protein
MCLRNVSPGQMTSVVPNHWPYFSRLKPSEVLKGHGILYLRSPHLCLLRFIGEEYPTIATAKLTFPFVRSLIEITLSVDKGNEGKAGERTKP